MKHKYSCFANASIRLFLLSTLFASLLIVPIIKAQELAPLKLGNIWIYGHGPGTKSLGRYTVVDTNIINSIPYFEFSIESNYGGATDSHYVRLREDSFYVYLNNFNLTETPYYKKRCCNW